MVTDNSTPKSETKIVTTFTTDPAVYKISGTVSSDNVGDNNYKEDIYLKDDTAYVKNKIYVVTYNDEGYIKRVEVKDKKKVITLKSDNPDYDDIDISEEMQEYFKINGRVVEVISKKRVL